MKHSRHHLRHAPAYPVTLLERVWTIVVGPLLILCLLAVAFYFYPILAPRGQSVALSTIFLAGFITLGRLLVAYVCAAVVAVPLAIAAVHSKRVEKVLLPMFDVLQSVPILALFPVVIMLFIRFGNLNGAAIFILFLTMLWNIVFTLIGGLQLIPHDVIDAARIFGLRGFSYVRRLLIPALVPQFVTGSILAFASGWNITIVAEVLHTYLPGGSSSEDLFGVGSILVAAAANAQQATFFGAVFVMVVLIAAVNFLVWQKLLHYSQRFRFE